MHSRTPTFDDRVWKLLRERLQGTALPADRTSSEKKRVITRPSRNIPERRLGPLPCGERQRKLREAAPGRRRQREGAAEARVDVGHQMRAVRLSEALDVGRADEPERLRDVPPDLDQLGVANRHALDRLAALRLDHRPRNGVEAARLEIAEEVDRELLAGAARLHHRVLGRVVEEELELAAVARSGRCRGSRSRGAPSRAPGTARSSGSASGSHVSRRADSALDEEHMGEPLVGERVDDLGRRQQHECAELVPGAGEHSVIEVGQRNDQLDVVRLDEAPQGRRRSPGRRPAARRRARPRSRARARGDSRRSRASVAPARLNAVTMSTRCPAHVKRTPLTGGEGTRLCFTRPGDPPSAPRPGLPRRQPGSSPAPCSSSGRRPRRRPSAGRRGGRPLRAPGTAASTRLALIRQRRGTGARHLEPAATTRSGERRTAGSVTRRRTTYAFRVICFRGDAPTAPRARRGRSRGSRGSTTGRTWSS